MRAEDRVPQHVAIIMDGNGRWAVRRGRPRIFGHVRGASRVKAIVREADRLGVRVLTLYAFSTENWNRPQRELDVLWKLLKKFLRRELDELDRQNVRLSVVGEIDRLGPDVRQILDPAIKRLSENTGLRLNFAVSYGSRSEIARATRLIAEEYRSGRISEGDINEGLVGKYLWTSHLDSFADVDLVIRTSGEKRVSNFLLWQSAYAEYVFLDVCWPDFSAADFREAIEEYSRRDRRFGGVKTLEQSEVQGRNAHGEKVI